MATTASRITAGNWITILIFVFATMISSGGVWAAMSSRVSTLETKVEYVEQAEAGFKQDIKQMSGDIHAMSKDMAVIRARLAPGPPP